MKKVIPALVVLCAMASLVSCSTVQKKMSESITESIQTPRVSIPTPSLDLSSIFEAGEYLVGDYETSAWLECGKMLTPPSESTGEAEFLTYTDSQKKWKRYFVRIAPAKEFKVGDELIYFTGNQKEEVYQPPTDRSSARESYWYKALVTDTSLVKSRGIVYIGGEKVDVKDAFVGAKQ